MANVRLFRDGEKEINGLPWVCMRCGALAVRTRSATFQDTIWRQQRIAVPLCEKHWRHARLFRAIRLACGGMLFIIGWSVLFGKERMLSLKGQGMVGLLVWPVSYFIACLFFIVVHWISGNLLGSGVQTKKITETYVELTNVAPEFLGAVAQDSEALLQRLANEGGYFKASVGSDEGILPTSDESYRAKR